MITVFAIALTGCFTATMTTTVSPGPSDSAEVVGVVARFHSALALGDSASALGLLDRDAIILESGVMETREEYRSHHLPADIEFAHAVKSSESVVRVGVGGTAGWVASTSVSRGKFNHRQISSDGAELMVLRKTEQGWKIAAIHWSSRARRIGPTGKR